MRDKRRRITTYTGRRAVREGRTENHVEVYRLTSEKVVDVRTVPFACE